MQKFTGKECEPKSKKREGKGVCDQPRILGSAIKEFTSLGFSLFAFKVCPACPVPSLNFIGIFFFFRARAHAPIP